jgi:aminoglycoside phosphotransferase (APT) family kinase protein
MPTPWQRDLEQDGKKLSEWLGGKLPDAREITVSGLRAPESSGFSNDTLLFDLQYRQDGDSHHEPMVVRIAPTGFQIFPEYDMGLQFHTMERLAATDVPVPKVYWLEDGNPELLGADFYVMGRVEGRVPSDNPPYHKDGWLTEVSPEERRAIWLASYECMAKIHRLDYRALGFDFLDKPELGETPLDQQIAYYKNYLAWAARGLEQPTLEAALEWLERHKPDDDRKQLSWGDARIGNIIYDGTTPAAVIDWEMVTLGSPEQDVAWEIFLDRHHSEGIETPRLEGFPSYDETLAYYTKHSGFEVNDLHYYQAFAGFRFGVIMVRIAQQLLEYEFMDANTSRGFELNNTVTRLLAKTLELPAPGAGNDGFDA